MKSTFLLVVLASAVLASDVDTAGKGIPCPKGLPLCKCKGGYEMYYKINPVTSCQQCACREKQQDCATPPPCNVRCMSGYEMYYPIDPITHCPGGQCGCRKLEATPDNQAAAQS